MLAHDAAAVLYDTLVAYLRLGLRTILVLALAAQEARQPSPEAAGAPIPQASTWPRHCAQPNSSA